MGYYSVKKHFAEYHQVLFQIQEIDFKYVEIWTRLTKTGGWNADKVMAGRTRPKAASTKDEIPFELFEELTILEERKKELKQREQKLHNKHLKEIALVNDEKLERILRSVYLCLMPYEDIAEIMKITPATVRNLKYIADRKLLGIIERKTT